MTLEGSKKLNKVKSLAYKVLSKKLIRFAYQLIEGFALSEFKKDFQYWQTLSDSSKSKKRIAIRLDHTKSGHKYSKRMPELRKLYDYVSGSYINCHEIAVLLVSIGKKDYVVDFVLIKESHEGGYNVICQKLIKRFLNNLGGLKKDFLHYARLSLDGAYGNGTMMDFIEEKGFRYAAVKSSGKDLVEYQGNSMKLKELEQALSQRNDFREFNPKHGLKGDFVLSIVTMKRTGQEIKVLLRRFKAKKRKYRYLLILSLDKDIEHYQIAQCYQRRWKIEDCFKESKGIVDLMGYSYHSKSSRNIEMFITLRLICYMILNWYRVEHCRPSKTSMWKVAKRFKKEFNAIGQKDLWNLFSP